MALHGIHIKPSHKGRLHADLGKKPGAKLSEKDLERAKHSKDPAERKRATFAINAKSWNHSGKKSTSRADRMYGGKGKS